MSKGEETRQRILDRAFRLASRDGLEGLSIGTLASDLGLSKSGLFAHFGSKEDLQVAVIGAAAARFEEAVIKRGLRAPRGLPRVQRLFDHWLQWITDPALPGGCLFLAAATELDDREGPARDALIGVQKQFLDLLTHAARLAVGEGHFRKTLDCESFAFDMYAIVLGYNHARRLLHEPKAEARSRAAFERLVAFATRKG
jgi:AcrR family transcriptional regulator